MLRVENLAWALVGACIAAVIFTFSSLADDQVPDHGREWGQSHFRLADGERFPATLSTSEVTRISFDGDRVAGVRSAQNGEAGGPVINWERDDATGDLYGVVSGGRPGQVISAFITTERGATYQALFTLADQPAAQIFISGIGSEGGQAPARAGRAQVHAQRIVEFAVWAAGQSPQARRSRPEIISEGVSLSIIGDVERDGLIARFFEFSNITAANVDIRHEAFADVAVLAVVSSLDEIPAGGRARVFTVMEAR
ncbi:MAG TPA: hypothetical protein DF715_04550 [Oceanicaulis sp.]|nr:hypothetical protein [Oceanicaulis sp.]